MTPNADEEKEGSKEKEEVVLRSADVERRGRAALPLMKYWASATKVPLLRP
jgi:hypothetical protein